MIMKTKHAKNTGQMVRRGNIEKLPGGGGQRGQIARGGLTGKIVKRDPKGPKNCTGGHWPFCPIAIVRP